MARVSPTSAEVIQIMDNCTVSTVIIDGLILSARALLDTIFSTDTDMTDTVLTEIERWFVAHMIATGIQRSTKEEKVGDASVSYTGYWSKGLESTPYGQMVITLDFTGRLKQYSNKGRASIYAVPGFDD